MLILLFFLCSTLFSKISIMCRFTFTFIVLLVYFVTCLWKGVSDVEVRS